MRPGSGPPARHARGVGLAALIAVAGLGAGCKDRSARTRPWLADYGALKAHLERAYAGLAWAAAHGVDLAARDAETTRVIREADSAVEARVAVEAFLAAFDDPELGPRRPVPRRAAACAPPRRPGGLIRWERVADFRQLGGGAFVHGVFSVDSRLAGPAGALASAGGRTVGVLRIASLAARELPPSCDPDVLVSDLAAALAELRAAGAGAVVVDLTGTAGGEPALATRLAAELLGATPRCPAVSVVRHPHWARKVEEALGAAAGAGPRASLERLLAELQRPCDLAPLWRGEAVACSQLTPVEAPVWPCATATPAAPRPPGERLAVLVDGDTSPAAERLAALLAEQGGAGVAGAPTSGGGCGLPDGEIPIDLPALELTVEVPGCVRRLPGGEVHRTGVIPEVLLDGADWTPSAASAIATTLDRAAAP